MRDSLWHRVYQITSARPLRLLCSLPVLSHRKVAKHFPPRSPQFAAGPGSAAAWGFSGFSEVVPNEEPLGTRTVWRPSYHPTWTSKNWDFKFLFTKFTYTHLYMFLCTIYTVYIHIYIYIYIYICMYIYNVGGWALKQSSLWESRRGLCTGPGVFFQHLFGTFGNSWFLCPVHHGWFRKSMFFLISVGNFKGCFQ